jgi:regulator of sigma E protease
VTLILSWLIGIAAVAGMFLLLIGPHEGGHFLLAKLFRVNVYEFSLGMGTRLWSATRNGTLYALRLLPVGGYVRLAGMEPGDYDAPNGFHSKAAWKRLLVLLAGPGVNFLIAALAATAIALTQVNTDPGHVVNVLDPSPAWSAGIRAGDHIDSVNGVPVSSQQQIRQQVTKSGGEPLTLVVRHPGGAAQTLTVTPVYNGDQQRDIIGVGTQLFTPGQAIMAGVTFPYYAAIGIVMGIYALASGQVPGGFFGPEGATGAIGIGFLTVEAAQAGWVQWLNIVAILSVALGMANLLPLPALDGGRIVVVALEKIRGKPFNREKEMQFQRAGLVALLALVAFIAYFDIQRIINHQFPGFGQ